MSLPDLRCDPGPLRKADPDTWDSAHARATFSLDDISEDLIDLIGRPYTSGAPRPQGGQTQSLPRTRGAGGTRPDQGASPRAWVPSGRNTRGTMTTHRPDWDPFDPHRNQWWLLLKEQFPTRGARGGISGIRYKPGGEGGAAYLKRLEDTWEDVNGSHPHGVSNTLFRSEVERTLPSTVQKKLQDTVGLNHLDHPTWEAHVLHHLERYEEDQAQDDEDACGDTLPKPGASKEAPFQDQHHLPKPTREKTQAPQEEPTEALSKEGQEDEGEGVSQY
ncbi:unnamed protein product [Merluccius merluccius]